MDNTEDVIINAIKNAQRTYELARKGARAASIAYDSVTALVVFNKQADPSLVRLARHANQKATLLEEKLRDEVARLQRGLPIRKGTV